MAKSLFQVVMQSATPIRNILAEDGGGKTALQAAIEAAAELDGVFQNAMQLDGESIDYEVAPAVEPATDEDDRAVYRVQFQTGSGPDGSTPPQVRVISSSQTEDGITTHAADLAVAKALDEAPDGAVANAVYLVGGVDIDATA